MTTEEEFADIVVRANPEGQITRVRDVGRVELGANLYALRSLLDNKPAVAIGIFQRPGTNALDASDQVRHTMEQLKQSFPEGVDYRIVYDPTIFVRNSIEAVVDPVVDEGCQPVLVDRIPESELGGDATVEPVEQGEAVAAFRRRRESEELARTEVVQELRVRIGGGVMELVDDDDVERVRVDRRDVHRAERLNGGEDVPPFVGAMAVDVQLAERTVAHDGAEHP